MTLAWRLRADGHLLEIFHFNPRTGEVVHVESLKFTQQKTREDAYRFVRANFEELQDESVGSYVA